jgi:molecular chaperone DnaK (HSP70)
MKKTMTILAILISTSVFAQYKVKVSEKSENIAGANNNVFTVDIYEASVKDVENGWKKEMKNMGAKVSMKKEMFGDDASLKSMGDNTFDIYAIAKENKKENKVEFIVGIDLGGAFLNSGQHSDKAKVMKEVIYKFAVEMTKEAIAGIIKEEEKKLKSIEKEQESLESDKKKLEDNIKDWEKSIEKAKKEIEDNKKKQEDKKKEIEAQSKVVKDIQAKEKAVK